MLNLTNYLSAGQNNTLKFQKDFSFKNPWIQVYSNTTIDTWNVGAFSSASYFITVEYDSNQKETMQVLVIARPAQASYTIYGRTTIDQQLITLTATVTNAQLILTASATSGHSGAKLSFVASYIETIQPLTTPTTVSTSPVGSLPLPVTNPVPVSFSSVSVSGQPTISAATVGDNFSLVAGSGIGITTNSSAKTITLSSSFPFFQNIQVAGSTTLVPASASTSLTYSANNGLTITTTPASNTINFGIGTLPSLSISGTASVGTSLSTAALTSNNSILNVATTVTGTLTINGVTSASTINSSSMFNSTLDITQSLNQGAFNYGTLLYTDTNIFSSYTSSINSYNQMRSEEHTSELQSH